MHIAFYAAVSGLADNGGTNTIIRTADALRERGHRVDIVAAVDRFTRVPHPECVRFMPPDAEVVCAVSYMDVLAMHKLTDGRGMRQYWWMRLWDNPTSPDMQTLAAMQPTIVNAGWMQARLLTLGVTSQCIPQGIDIDFWCEGWPSARQRRRIGAVVRSEARKNFGDALWLSTALPGFEFSFVKNHSPEEMREWYRTLDYFLAPASVEGLPNTPMEASLCGAAILCRHNDEAGCLDFADEQSALMYGSIDEVPAMLAADGDDAKAARVAESQRIIRERIGSRGQCAAALERVFS